MISDHAPDLALYIHWPFCAALCPYCDFTRGLWSNAATQDPQVWADAYQAEVAYWAQHLGPRKITSIFFGGGTPSLMPLQVIDALLQAVRKYFGPLDLDLDLEITLEMNPTSFEALKVQEMMALGVNRISVGIQSLRPETLTWLGRNHSRDEALCVLSWLKEAGISFSFDLMYAHIHHTVSAVWKEELQEALQYADGHISLYQLTLEPGTPFSREAKKGTSFVLPCDAAADLYLWTQEHLGSLGWSAYEVSNYARNQAYSQHNLAYWRYQDYLGIGTGAHGRVTLPCGQKYALVNQHSSSVWLSQVQKLGHGMHHKTLLTALNQFKERLLMGLRLQEGVDQVHLRQAPKSFWIKIQQLEDTEYLTLRQGRVTLTLEGRLRMDEILKFLCADLGAEDFLNASSYSKTDAAID